MKEHEQISMGLKKEVDDLNKEISKIDDRIIGICDAASTITENSSWKHTTEIKLEIGKPYIIRRILLRNPGTHFVAQWTNMGWVDNGIPVLTSNYTAIEVFI